MEDRMVALELFAGSLQHNESFALSHKESDPATGGDRVLHNGSVNAWFGVYDGHGGAYVSHLLAKRLHRHVLHAQDKHRTFSKTLKQGFLAMDQECQQLCNDEGLFCGSTAIVLCIAGTKLYCGNVGDCRGVLLRGDKAVELSCDHKPDRQEERTRIEAAGGTVQVLNGVARVDRLSVARSFGDIEYKQNRNKKFSADLVIARPDVTCYSIQEQDKFVILACDGLWDVMSSQAACNLVWRSLAASHDVDKAAKELTSSAVKMQSSDNVSAIVICFHQE